MDMWAVSTMSCSQVPANDIVRHLCGNHTVICPSPAAADGLAHVAPIGGVNEQLKAGQRLQVRSRLRGGSRKVGVHSLQHRQACGLLQPLCTAYSK